MHKHKDTEQLHKNQKRKKQIMVIVSTDLTPWKRQQQYSYADLTP